MREIPRGFSDPRGGHEARRGARYICAECGATAEPSYGGRECHRCRDWVGCGFACDLSGLRCRACDNEWTAVGGRAVAG